MDVIKATTIVNIFGTSNAWSLEPEAGASEASTETFVELEIQGDEKHGYFLVISPEGFFTADYWYESKNEAMESAEQLFGITRLEWL